MEVVNYNGTSLAFIGDAWMSLQVRLYMLERLSKARHPAEEVQ